LKLDDLKEVVGRYGKVSKEGLYSGVSLGRFGGGYTGYKLGDKFFEEPDLIELYPVMDSGSAGPEELAVYSSVLTGYFLGGVLTAKGVTKIQELRQTDFRYRRPVNKSIEKIEDLADFSESEEDVDDIDEALEFFFDDKD